MDARDVVQVAMADVKMHVQSHVGHHVHRRAHLTASVAQELAILDVVIHV